MAKSRGELLPDSTTDITLKFSPHYNELKEDYFADKCGKQFGDQVYGETKDLSITELIADFKEIQDRLQKVEEVNKRLKRERDDLLLRLDGQKIEMMKLKMANEQLLESKSTSDGILQENLHQVKKQLSITVQENVCLKEASAKVNIENMHLKHEIADMYADRNKMKRKLDQLHNELKENRSSVQISKLFENVQYAASKNLLTFSQFELLPKSMEKQSHANSAASFADVSAKLLSQCHEEKKELELQCQQMVEFQKPTEQELFSNTPSEFSLLGFETTETDDLKAANECLQNLATTKQDLVFTNFYLKYLLHLLSKKQQQGLTSNSDLQANDDDSCSSDIVADGIKTDSLASKFIPSWKSPNTSYQTNSKFELATEKQLAHLNTTPKPMATNSKPPASSSRLNHNVEKLSDNSSPQRRANSKISDTRSPFQPPAPLWHYKNKIAELHNPNTEIVVNNVTISPNFCRSDSAKGNVGSPPQFSTLSYPDSLCVDGSPQALHNFKDSIDSIGQALREETKDEDRICPMCEASFPKCVDQKDFEAHVVSHFDVEEFELI